MDNFRKTFGEWLAGSRISHNLTQAKLANKLGIRQQTLSLYEKGTRLMPLDTLKTFCTILNVSPAGLFPANEKIAPADKELLRILHMFGDSEDLLLKFNQFAKVYNHGKNTRKTSNRAKR